MSEATPHKSSDTKKPVPVSVATDPPADHLRTVFLVPPSPQPASPSATRNQTIAAAAHKAAPVEWMPVSEAPIDEEVVLRKEFAWIGATGRFNGVEWEYLSAPDIAHSDPVTMNPMLPPTHWKPLKRE